MTHAERIHGGLLGLLIGDACGVPYEFRSPGQLPPFAQIDMWPPPDFVRSYSHVPLGTWSDDGAQALCLLDSLLACGRYHAHDFATRLLRWHDEGYLAVDQFVFDIGNQTSAAIARLKAGRTTDDAGLCGERNNGNGSLMRCLPLALLHQGNERNLVIDAHRQSRITHGHPRSQVACALYLLWARQELRGTANAWSAAVTTLREIYRFDPLSLRELETHFCGDALPPPRGTGYVVDALLSAKRACEAPDFESIIRTAIAFGHDTDTTAAIAGGIAGIRFGVAGIPSRWRNGLRAMDLVQAFLRRIDARLR